MRTERAVKNIPIAFGGRWFIAPEYEWRVILTKQEQVTLAKAAAILSEMRERAAGPGQYGDDQLYDFVPGGDDLSCAEAWLNEVKGWSYIPLTQEAVANLTEPR